MGVMMQAFYWDCPRLEGVEHAWWPRLEKEVRGLAQAGFTALWLPPANKAASTTSMGYDPYDFYDLGDFDQKGDVPTWFGTKATLRSLINAAHDAGLQVYADLVLNHNSGGDALEKNPIDGRSRWTLFKPKSGKFARDWTCFHPCRYETADDMTFGEMPDLCHRNPDVYEAILGVSEWMINEIGYDGFRFDFVKGYGGWMVRAILEQRGLHGTKVFKPFAVGECWDSDRTIDDWLSEVNAFSDNPVAAFDFPLRYRLRDLCQSFGFSLRTLAMPGTIMTEQPSRAVTFVENHDIVRNDSIVQGKMLAYAVIMTHPGYPCVFWQDWFDWGLARLGQPDGIAALIEAHERSAGGDFDVLYVDEDLYVMQRAGWQTQSGLVFVLNNRGTWNGIEVATNWRNTAMIPVAWHSEVDPSTPQSKTTDFDGRSAFWAPPRGYVVYEPRH